MKKAFTLLLALVLCLGLLASCGGNKDQGSGDGGQQTPDASRLNLGPSRLRNSTYILCPLVSPAKSSPQQSLSRLC